MIRNLRGYLLKEVVRKKGLNNETDQLIKIMA